MDDLTITRLCAEAMGYRLHDGFEDGVGHTASLLDGQSITFNPLYDGAQCFLMIKRFKSPHFQIWSDDEVTSGKWHAWMRGLPEGTSSDSLNRAICECVAKLHQAKSTG